MDKLLTSETNLDISHEALIRNWDKLRTWVHTEADSAKSYLLLEQTAQRHKKGQAALWNTPDLETALEWERKQQPSALWAKRYGADFSLAMDFLRQSQQRQEDNIRQKRQEQEAREEELRNRAEQEMRRADLEMSLREMQERSRRAAIARSQNYVCRAKQRINQVNRPRGNVIALYYLSVALRLDQANLEAAELAYRLLLEKHWFPPVTPAIRSDSQILAGRFSPNGQKAMAVLENGNLFSLSGRNFTTASTTPLFPEITPPLGGKLLVSASFSSDGLFLLVCIDQAMYGAVKAQMFRWSEPEQTYHRFCHQIDLNDSFRHPVVWNEDASLLITLSQKFDGASFQVFRRHGETYIEVCSPFGKTEITAALYAKDLKQVVTASPGGVVRFWDVSSLQHQNEASDAKASIKMPKGGIPICWRSAPRKTN